MNFWKDKRVLVTGASGLIGSWLGVNLVRQSAKVSTLLWKEPKESMLFDSPEFKKFAHVVDGNITDANALDEAIKKFEPEVCFHLAAQTQVIVANENPVQTFETNIRGTWLLLDRLLKTPSIRAVVVASSDKAYGDQRELPYTEASPLNGLYPYDASKVCEDVLARCYSRAYGLPVAVTRCANVYGGGDFNFLRIVPDAMRSVCQDKNPVIRSDGTPERDYLYVRDCVNGYLLLAEQIEKAKGGAVNFGTGKPTSVLELVDNIIKTSGKNLKPEILGKSKPKGEIDLQFISAEKAKKILGWEPQHSLEAGLRETYSWYSAYFRKKGF